MNKAGEKGRKEYTEALERVKKFATNEGRNPRILVAKMG
jgi:methylmalonyl-CoA mutase cobalamin-binding subunit